MRRCISRTNGNTHEVWWAVALHCSLHHRVQPCELGSGRPSYSKLRVSSLEALEGVSVQIEIPEGMRRCIMRRCIMRRCIMRRCIMRWCIMIHTNTPLHTWIGCRSRGHSSQCQGTRHNNSAHSRPRNTTSRPAEQSMVSMVSMVCMVSMVYMVGTVHVSWYSVVSTV
jgi:hypothetical protein